MESGQIPDRRARTPPQFRHGSAGGPGTFTIHVVSDDRPSLPHALKAVCGGRVRIQACTSLPARDLAAIGNVLLLDLTHLPTAIRCEDVAVLTGRILTLALAGPGSLDARWLDLVVRHRVELVTHERNDGRERYASAALAIARHLDLPDSAGLAEEILTRLPLLRPLSDLVALICAEPWRFRRPRDLAVRCGGSLASVVRRCRGEGFIRAEHFLTMTRIELCDVLVQQHGRRRWLAQLLAGVTDASNLRRQAARARRPRPESCL